MSSVRCISLYTNLLSPKLPRELDASGEVDDGLHAQPDGFDTRLSIPLTRQKATQTGDQADDFIQARGLVR